MLGFVLLFASTGKVRADTLHNVLLWEPLVTRCVGCSDSSIGYSLQLSLFRHALTYYTTSSLVFMHIYYTGCRAQTIWSIKITSHRSHRWSHLSALIFLPGSYSSLRQQQQQQQLYPSLSVVSYPGPAICDIISQGLAEARIHLSVF